MIMWLAAPLARLRLQTAWVAGSFIFRGNGGGPRSVVIPFIEMSPLARFRSRTARGAWELQFSRKRGWATERCDSFHNQPPLPPHQTSWLLAVGPGHLPLAAGHVSRHIIRRIISHVISHIIRVPRFTVKNCTRACVLLSFKCLNASRHLNLNKTHARRGCLCG